VTEDTWVPIVICGGAVGAAVTVGWCAERSSFPSGVYHFTGLETPATGE
jgi:hypothetical protein